MSPRTVITSVAATLTVFCGSAAGTTQADALPTDAQVSQRLERKATGEVALPQASANTAGASVRAERASPKGLPDEAAPSSALEAANREGASPAIAARASQATGAASPRPVSPFAAAVAPGTPAAGNQRSRPVAGPPSSAREAAPTLATAESGRAGPGEIVLPPVPGAPRDRTRPPQLSTPLPGVGTLPGARAINAPNTVRIGQGGHETVPVSQRYVNRIATPFLNARVHDTSGAEILAEGSNVYLRPAGNEPIAVYVSGDQPGDAVVSLLLEPMDIAPQTVILQLEDRYGARNGPAQEALASDYIGQIVQALRNIALDRAPVGFSGGPLPQAVGQMGDLTVAPQSRYSGSQYDVFVYLLTNQASTRVALDEAAFYADEGVRAVAFYPNADLGPGEQTRVMVVHESRTRGE